MTARLVAEQRTDRRAVTMLTAEVAVGSATWPARIRNISTGGALIEGVPVTERGTQVVLSRGQQCAAGEVIWCDPEALAIQFNEPINPAEWLRSGDSSGERSRHREVRDDCRPDDLPTEIIASRVREEMAFVSRLVEGVADLLSEDPILRVRHATRIQELCVGEQMLTELIAILERGCSANAVVTNATGPMRQRLLRGKMRTVDS